MAAIPLSLVRRRRSTVILISGLALATAHARAQCPEASLVPSRWVNESEAPGPTVAISAAGATALLGMSADSGTVPDGGAGFVFQRQRDGWKEVAKLVPPGIANGASVGLAVALSLDGTRAFLGGAGSAWVYRLDDRGWSLEQQLVERVTGRGLCMSPDGTVAALRRELVSGGAQILLFRRTGMAWSLVQTIPAPPPGQPKFNTNAAFSTDGCTFAIGQDVAGSPFGPYASVYVCNPSTNVWELEAQVTGMLKDASLALSGDGSRLVVGDWRALAPDGTGGRVLVFDRVEAEWTLLSILHAKGPAPSTWLKNRFGVRVAVSEDGTRILASDNGDSALGIVSGAFYVIDQTRNGWCPLPKVAVSGGTSGTGAGWRIAVSPDGATGLVSRDIDWNESQPPAAVVYSLVGEDGDADGVFDDCDNCPEHANPQQFDCDGDGVGDVCALASGASDCNGNATPDACDLAATTVQMYVADDGTVEGAVGAFYLPIIWMNQFQVVPGGEVVSAIDIAWGDIPQGSLATVALWTDPNNDGVPDDGQLLVSVEQVVVEHPWTNTFNRIAIPPTFVGSPGQSFFIGAFYPQGFPVGSDFSPPSMSQGWLFWGTQLGDLSLNSAPSPSVTLTSGPFNPMVRGVVSVQADCNQNGLLDSCEIDADPSLDLNGNGVLDECDAEADLDRDGDVDGADLGLLLGAWGSPAPGDLDGDGVVGAADLGALLAAWTG